MCTGFWKDSAEERLLLFQLQICISLPCTGWKGAAIVNQWNQPVLTIASLYHLRACNGIIRANENKTSSMCVLTFTRCHYIYSKLLFHICTIVFTFEHLDAFNVTLDVNYISDFSFTSLKYGEQMKDDTGFLWLPVLKMHTVAHIPWTNAVWKGEFENSTCLTYLS